MRVVCARAPSTVSDKQCPCLHKKTPHSVEPTPCVLASYCAVLCHLRFFLLGCLLTRFAITLDMFVSLDGPELIRYPCRSRCERLLNMKDYKVVFEAILKLYSFLGI